MTTFNWQIVNMDRQTSDGFVVTVHYNVSATDGNCSASTYGTVGYTEQPGEALIPYDQLTHEVVVGWVQESLRKETVEANLQSQIDTQKTPEQASGMPWLMLQQCPAPVGASEEPESV
jgi:hypothetical protein